MYQSQLGQSPTITKIFSHKEIPSNVLSYLWSRSLRASCRISSWLLFRKVYFPQEENGTYQNTSLGPFPAIQAGNNNQPAPAHSDCCLSWLSSSRCTAWAPPSHPIPSVAHVQRSFWMYQGVIMAQAGIFAKTVSLGVAGLAQPQIPKEKTGIACNSWCREKKFLFLSTPVFAFIWFCMW